MNYGYFINILTRPPPTGPNVCANTYWEGPPPLCVGGRWVRFHNHKKGPGPYPWPFCILLICTLCGRRKKGPFTLSAVPP